MFVLYGITASQVPKLPELILEGVRTLLRSEYVRPEIIEQYLADCGKDVTFFSTSSRSATANCTKACERVKLFVEFFQPKDLFHAHLLPYLNHDLFPKEKYAFFNDVLIRRLAERYGEPVQSCRAVELEVTLHLLTPCKRTLILPCNLNFFALHLILQIAFGWQDCHLHQFILEDDPQKLIGLFDPEFDGIDSLTVDVGSVFSTYEAIQYEYDLGDDWMHTIRRKRFLEDCDTLYPQCIEAIGDAPVEDCGGAEGFYDLQNILQNPSHTDYQDAVTWLGSTKLPGVNLEQINNALLRFHQRNMTRRLPGEYYSLAAYGL